MRSFLRTIDLSIKPSMNNKSDMHYTHALHGKLCFRIAQLLNSFLGYHVLALLGYSLLWFSSIPSPSLHPLRPCCSQENCRMPLECICTCTYISIRYYRRILGIKLVIQKKTLSKKDQPQNSPGIVDS